MKNLIFFSVFVFMISQSGFSQNYNDNSNYFNPFFDIYSQNYLSVQAAGKGYTGIAGRNNLSGTILNPASLEQKNKIQIYGEYLYKSEDHFYEGNSDDFYGQYNPTMLAGFSYKISKDFTAGALYENNNNYKINLETTNEYGEPTGKDVSNTFSVSSVSVPVVYSTDMIKFGINLKYVFYSAKLEGSDNADFKESFEKFVPDFGIIYSPINNLSIGATFTPEVSENVEYTGSDTSYVYPDANIFPYEIGAGISYTFDKTPLTLLMDYHFINTSSEEYLKDRNDFNFGVEYVINKLFTVRSGIFIVKDFRELEEKSFVGSANPGSYSQTFGTIGGTINYEKFNFNLSVIDSRIFSSGNITQTQINFGAGYDF